MGEELEEPMGPNDTNELGRIIRERRKAKQLTLRQLAAISGVSGAHLARIETSKRFPSGRILRRLAAPLGFGEVELLKLAGFLSWDNSDDQVEKVKAEIKLAVSQALIEIQEKIDSL